MPYKVGIGQDSHRFSEGGDKPLILGGVEIPFDRSLEGNSDADVVLHAICNAVSGISGTPILGECADRLCNEQGISDSSVYLQKALETLEGYKVSHVSVSVECLAPRLSPHLEKMRARIASIMGLGEKDVAVTATSGEGLTAFGQGLGIQVMAAVTAVRSGD